MQNPNYKPSRVAEERICKFCKSIGANRWDAGEQYYEIVNSVMKKVPGPQYCCENCDPMHKWFDLTEADYMDKRERRRIRREAALGPEREIVETIGDFHQLSCGHVIAVKSTETSKNTSRRCKLCL